MDYNNLQTHTIDWIKFPLSVAIIFTHMGYYTNLQNIDYLNLTSIDFVNIIITLNTYVIALIAVPAFFLLSGYLFFYNIYSLNRATYYSKLHSRISTLLIPFIFWNLLFVIAYFFYYSWKSDSGGILYLQNILDEGFWKIFVCRSGWSDYNIFGNELLCYAPENIPLWFLSHLMIMVFISPIIYFAIKKGGITTILILGIAYYLKIGITIPGFGISQWLTALFFFSFGAYFSINKINIVLTFRQYKWAWICTAIITMLLSAYYHGSYLKYYFIPVFIITGIISMIIISSYLIEKKYAKVSPLLRNSSFFIYVSQSILIIGVSKVVLNKFLKLFLNEQTPTFIFLAHFIGALFSLLIIMILYIVLRRICPQVLRLLMGHR